MARSRRSRPICGITTAASDKEYKKAEHRRERAAARRIVAAGGEPESPKAFGSPWNSRKDGKQYYGRIDRATKQKLMRK